MYEHRSAPLLPWPSFRRRMVRHVLWAALLVGVSMVVGTWGFTGLAGEMPIDAFLNAAMLLGGMGPVSEIRFTVGKVFAALQLAFFAWAVVLLLIGVRAVHGWTWGRAGAAVLAAASIPAAITLLVVML